MTRKFWYTMDYKGVTEILKSAPVKALLKEEAEKQCAAANRLISARYSESVTGKDYVVEENDLTFTSVARVVPNTTLAKFDQGKNRTLDSINH